MAMETVTNYTCDRCGRSEIKDSVTILTLTVRKRAGKNVPGQGETLFTKHVCTENCLKMIKAAMTPVGQSGRYDREAARKRREAASTSTPAASVTATQEPLPVDSADVAVAVPVIKINKSRTKAATKGNTKTASKPARRTLKAVADPAPVETRADVVRAVRAITRVNGGQFAKGYGPKQERAMIAERESINHGTITEKDL